MLDQSDGSPFSQRFEFLDQHITVQGAVRLQFRAPFPVHTSRPVRTLQRILLVAPVFHLLVVPDLANILSVDELATYSNQQYISVQELPRVRTILCKNKNVIKNEFRR